MLENSVWGIQVCIIGNNIKYWFESKIKTPDFISEWHNEVYWFWTITIVWWSHTTYIFLASTPVVTF